MSALKKKKKDSKALSLENWRENGKMVLPLTERLKGGRIHAFFIISFSKLDASEIRAQVILDITVTLTR